MHDFNCTDADDMNFDLMAERTRYLKENPEGVKEMSRIMEEMCNEVEEKRLLQDIRNLMETTKWTVEQAMDALKIPDYDKEKYAARLSANLCKSTYQWILYMEDSWLGYLSYMDEYVEVGTIYFSMDGIEVVSSEHPEFNGLYW